jgi:hypothetical protein
VTARRFLLLFLAISFATVATRAATQSPVGREVSIAQHLYEGEEFVISLKALLNHGQRLFAANWTSQEGGGRPLTKGNGKPISDQSAPLVFPRNFNRVSAPDANCALECRTG